MSVDKETHRAQSVLLARKSEVEILKLLEELKTKQDSLESLLSKFSGAFPGDDPDGHCRYHELVIKKEESAAALRQAIIEKSLAGLVWAGLVALGSAIWAYIQSHIGPH